jgi:hypothetical protein
MRRRNEPLLGRRRRLPYHRRPVARPTVDKRVIGNFPYTMIDDR